VTWVGCCIFQRFDENTPQRIERAMSVADRLRDHRIDFAGDLGHQLVIKFDLAPEVMVDRAACHACLGRDFVQPCRAVALRAEHGQRCVKKLLPCDFRFVLRAPCHTPYPIRTTCTAIGPCAPRINSCPMSAVRLLPVTTTTLALARNCSSPVALSPAKYVSRSVTICDARTTAI